MGGTIMRISECLGYGAMYAVTGEWLSKTLGCGMRDVTQMIERERRAGAPICASCNPARPGYFLASEPGELALYLASLDRRLRNVATTRRHLQDTLDRMEGQETIWEEDADDSFL